MTVATVCSRDVVSIDRDALLPQAARLMREHHVGTVVVTETRADGTHVVGVVTDRDIVIEALARGLEGVTVPVSALVGSGVLLAVPESAGIGAAIALMRTGGVRRLLVHDDEGHLVGVLSLDDLLRVVGAQIAGLADVLARGRERERADTGPLAAPGGEAGSPPTPPRPPRPVTKLRVPAMGTAGWTMPSQVGP